MVIFNVTQKHLKEFFGWTDDEETYKIMIMQTVLMIGAFMGSASVGTFLKCGRRFALLFICYGGIVATIFLKL